LGRFALVTIGRMRLVPVLDTMKCVVGTHEAEISECVDDPRVPPD
jgi:hypothetical protein